MENPSYPMLQEPQNLPQMKPMTIHQPDQKIPLIKENLEMKLKINWAQVFNIILLIGVTYMSIAYDPHLGDIIMLPQYKTMLLFKYALMIANIVYYFMTSNETVSTVLTILAYASFVELVLTILALVVVLNADLAYLLAVGIALVFITLPTFLIGITAWILLKNNKSCLSRNEIATVTQNIWHQNAPLKMNSEQPHKFSQVQFVMQP